MSNPYSFHPPRFIRNPHAQSILPDFMALRKKATLTLEILEAEKNKPFLLAKKPSAEEKKHPVLLCVPGIEGSHESAVIQLILANPNLDQHAIYIISHRGIHLRGKSISPYHAGLTEDIAKTVEHIKTHYGSHDIHAIGFSMGANQLLKYASKSNHGINTVTAISTPFDLAHCSDRIPSFYQNRILRRIYKRTANSGTLYDKLNWSAIKTIRDLDDALVAPHFGFNSADDYYHQNSSLQSLNKISCQTTLISASDDPFIQPDSWPKRKNLPKNINMISLKHGGHMGFVDFKGHLFSWVSKYIATTLQAYSPS